MSRATTITYANTLLDSLGDTTQLGQYYDEITMEIARGTWPDVVSMVGADFRQGVTGTSLYLFPDAAIRLLSVHYDRLQLAEASPSEADAYDREWRVTRGEPVAYTMADEADNTIRVVPVPDVTGESPTGITPVDFGAATWPSNNVAFVYTTNTSVHTDEEMWLALEMVARELARDSNHHDEEAAGLAKTLADLFRKMSHIVA